MGKNAREYVVAHFNRHKHAEEFLQLTLSLHKKHDKGLLKEISGQ
jgi:hypothetical protein